MENSRCGTSILKTMFIWAIKIIISWTMKNSVKTIKRRFIISRWYHQHVSFILKISKIKFIFWTSRRKDIYGEKYSVHYFLVDNTVFYEHSEQGKENNLIILMLTHSNREELFLFPKISHSCPSTSSDLNSRLLSGRLRGNLATSNGQLISNSATWKHGKQRRLHWMWEITMEEFWYQWARQWSLA